MQTPTVSLLPGHKYELGPSVFCESRLGLCWFHLWLGDYPPFFLSAFPFLCRCLPFFHARSAIWLFVVGGCPLHLHFRLVWLTLDIDIVQPLTASRHTVLLEMPVFFNIKRGAGQRGTAPSFARPRRCASVLNKVGHLVTVVTRTNIHPAGCINFIFQWLCMWTDESISRFFQDWMLFCPEGSLCCSKLEGQTLVTLLFPRVCSFRKLTRWKVHEI